MKKQIVAILIALVVVTCLAASVLSETKEINEDLQCYEGVILKLNEAWKPAKEITSLTDTKDIIKTTGTNQQDSDFIEWTDDSGEAYLRYSNPLSLAITRFDLDNIEFWAGELYRDCTERLVEIDQFNVTPAMQPAKNEFKKYLQDLKQFAYYCEKGAKEADRDDLDTSTAYLEKTLEHLKKFFKLIPEDTEEIPTFPLVDNVSLCDAIDISIGNATVTDFLNATNITTVQVSNFKGYKGENTWRVQWSFSNRLLDVYINVTTGNVVGIEEKTPTPAPTPTLTPTSTPTPTTTATLFEKIEGLTSISVGGGGWDNWDADMEKDGPVIHIYYLDARGDSIRDDSTKMMPISADVKLYAGDSILGPYDKLVFSAHYTEDEIFLGGSSPYIRIPKEEISVNPSTDYRTGAVEVTIYTPAQGSFADRWDYIRLYEE